MKTLDLIQDTKLTAVDHICSGRFKEVLDFALSNHEKSWKAAWLINQALKSEELPLQKYVKTICKAIHEKPSNHKRELLKLLEYIQLTEENEGYIFDVAVSCWEELKLQSGTRMVAFRLMAKITKRHPLLVAEIEALTENRFLEGLSPGIKHSVQRMREEVRE